MNGCGGFRNPDTHAILNLVSNQKQSVEQRFGDHLRALRLEQRVTQRELATRMHLRGFSWLQSTVTKAEQAARPLRLDEFVALCEVLDQSPPEVLSILTGMSDLDLRRRELERSIAGWQEQVDDLQSDAEVLQQMIFDARGKLEQLDEQRAAE